MNEISGQRRDTLIERLTERLDVTGDLSGTSGGGTVIYIGAYPPPPISTPLSSNGNGGGGGQDRQTRHRRADVVFTDITGAGEAGETGAAGEVFSHTGWVHTADATKLFCRVGIGGVYWALNYPTRVSTRPVDDLSTGRSISTLFSTCLNFRTTVHSHITTC